MLTLLESTLDYTFKCKSFLIRALMRTDNILGKPGTRTIRDFTSQEKIRGIGDQTALETLGDSIIDVYILEDTINKGASKREHMHNRKRDFGKNVAINRVAEKIQLYDFVYWSENEENTKIWRKQGSRVMAGCFEALIGAIYMDGRMESVKKTLDKMNFIGLIQEAYETYALTELEKSVHTCTLCKATDLSEILSHYPVYSFGDNTGKKIIVVGINPSTREYESNYLSASKDPMERKISQLTYFQRDYYDFFKKIEEFFKGEVQEVLGWIETPWEKVGFIDLVKCPTRNEEGQWGALKGSQKRRLIHNCHKYLERQLETLQPKIVIPYGADVRKWFKEKYKVHSKPFTSTPTKFGNKETKLLFLNQKQGPYKKRDIEKASHQIKEMLS